MGRILLMNQFWKNSFELFSENIYRILEFEGANRLLLPAVFWFILEIITRLIARSNLPSKAELKLAKLQDYGSWWLVVFSSFCMAVIILWILYEQWSPDLPKYFIPIGIILMCLGIALRIWAVMSLGQFFTMQVVVFSNHRLIDKGPYRWLCHPSYSGVFITTLGLGFATGYFVLLVTFLGILVVVLGYRIYIEEKALKEAFGKAWIVYSNQRWKLIPWIY